MIKFFRQSYAIQYVVIALLAVALWVPSFVSGGGNMGQHEPVTPLFNLIDGLLSFSPIVKLVFAFVLLLFEALLVNALLVNHQIIGKVSTMGAFVFVLMMSLTLAQASFYPFALSVVFILLLISVLFDLYLSQNPEMILLRAGVFVALASMCYFPSILLVVWVMIALPVAKKVSLRLELIPIMGFLLVYFFYFVGTYLFGDFLSMLSGYRDYFNALQLSVDGFNLMNAILLGFLLLSSFVLYWNNSGFEKTVSVRVKMTMIVLLLVLAVPMLFLGGDVLLNGLVFLALAIVFSYEFTNLDNTGWTDIVLALFLLLVFANKYYLKLL